MKRAGLFCLLASAAVAALLLGYIHWTPEAIFVRSPALPETTLLTATDLHYLSPELTDGGSAFTRMVDQGDGKMVGDSTALLEALVWQTIREAPDALILSGDLTFNGGLPAIGNWQPGCSASKPPGSRCSSFPATTTWKTRWQWSIGEVAAARSKA